MPPVKGCTKQDYAAVIGVGVEDRSNLLGHLTMTSCMTLYCAP